MTITPHQALRRAQKVLGPKAVVELSVVLTSNGDEIEERHRWSVGLQGHDAYSWQALGVSTGTFEAALAQAQGRGRRKRKR